MEQLEQPSVTLATIGDLDALCDDLPWGTLVSWHRRNKLGDADVVISGTKVYVWERMLPHLVELRGQIAVNYGKLSRHRKRASVPDGAVVLGVQEAAEVVGREVDVMRNYTSGRTKPPVEGFEPAALLGKASDIRKLPVFTVEQLRPWPGFDEEVAKRFAATNTLHAVRRGAGGTPS